MIRNIKKTKKFLKFASVMKPSITVFKNKSGLQLKIGAVEEVQQAGGISANTLMVAGGFLSAGMGDNLLMPEPVYYFPSNYSFTSYLSNKSVYFSSVLSSEYYSHLTKPITKYTINFIVDYANLLPGNHGMVTIFKFKGDYYLGYYTYGSNKYNIEWFKNVDDYSIQF